MRSTLVHGTRTGDEQVDLAAVGPNLNRPREIQKEACPTCGPKANASIHVENIQPYRRNGDKAASGKRDLLCAASTRTDTHTHTH